MGRQRSSRGDHDPRGNSARVSFSGGSVDVSEGPGRMENRRVGSQSSATMNRLGSERYWLKTVTVAAVLTGAVAGLTATPAEASSVEGIAGWEGDGFEQGYGFAMAGVSLLEGRAISIPVRVSGNYLYYNYDEAGEVIRVSGPGSAGLIGVRSTRPWGTVAVLTGGEIRWERRDRETMGGPGASVARGGIVAQVEGE